MSHKPLPLNHGLAGIFSPRHGVALSHSRIYVTLPVKMAFGQSSEVNIIVAYFFWQRSPTVGLSRAIAVLGLVLGTAITAYCETNQTSETTENPGSAIPPAQSLDLDPGIIEESPVLQRWLEAVPDVLEDIRHDPSFRTRLRFGYAQFPSTDQIGGYAIGVEDVFIGQTGLTWSADYQSSFNGDRQSVGTDLRYHLLPLGSYVNIAPQIGYRYLETRGEVIDGVNVGARIIVALSRGGAADISLSQTFVAPGVQEVGLTTLSAGYALTSQLRIFADIQKQNSTLAKDSRIGIGLEWLP